MSTTLLPVFVALIGLTGALIGAAAGLVGNQWAVRQQTARNERNFRRDVYGDFLEAVRTAHSKVQRRDAIKGASDANELAIALKAGLLDATSWIAAAEQLDDVASRLHRLHLAAHPLVYQAAVEIYQALGSASGVSIDDDLDLHHDIDVHFYIAIGIFTSAARADTLAPGHKQISTYEKNVRELQRDGKTLQGRVRQHRST